MKCYTVAVMGALLLTACSAEVTRMTNPTPTSTPVPYCGPSVLRYYDMTLIETGGSQEGYLEFDGNDYYGSVSVGDEKLEILQKGDVLYRKPEGELWQIESDAYPVSQEICGPIPSTSSDVFYYAGRAFNYWGETTLDGEPVKHYTPVALPDTIGGVSLSFRTSTQLWVNLNGYVVKMEQVHERLNNDGEVVSTEAEITVRFSGFGEPNAIPDAPELFAKSFFTVDELLAHSAELSGRMLGVRGPLIEGSFNRDSDALPATFQLHAEDAPLEAVYDGPIPDLFFHEDAEVWLEGLYGPDRVLAADRVHATRDVNPSSIPSTVPPTGEDWRPVDIDECHESRGVVGYTGTGSHHGGGGFSNMPLSESDSCLSAHRQGSYAQYYTYELDLSDTLEVEVSSESDIYIYLMAGAEKDGPVIAEAVASGSGSEPFAIRLEELDPGYYTLELATVLPGHEARYDLDIDAE